MDNTERFTTRADDYVRYRPSYPAALIPLLQRELGLEPRHVIADLGSGTGLSARLFLEHGHTVYGVEPNDRMRALGESFLSGFAKFHSVKGSAEATTLERESADFAVAGQAYHWFEPAGTKRELARILRPPRSVILIWNTWHQVQSPFTQDYGALVHRYALDANAVRRHSQDNLQSSVAGFFAPGGVEARVLPHGQTMDFEGLLGRVRSASYLPRQEHARYPEMVRALEALFERHQAEGKIIFPMETQIFWGSIIP